MLDDELRRFLVKAGSYTSKYEKTRKEVADKLNQWSENTLSEEEKEWILAELTKDKFINEERYVERFIRDKVYSLRKGPMVIRQELKERGVASSLIENGLNAIPDDDWFTSLREYLVPRLNRQKSKAKSMYDLRRKLHDAAYRRGYPSEIREEVIDGLDLDLNVENDEFDY